MGFRFNNLNPIYRTCVTRLSSSRILPHAPEPLNFFQSEAYFISPENPAFKITRRWHLGHSHHDHDHHHHLPQNSKEGENIFRLGLAADVALATGKAFTGYLSGSTAIIADAAHSVSDVVTLTLTQPLSRLLVTIVVPIGSNFHRCRLFLLCCRFSVA